MRKLMLTTFLTTAVSCSAAIADVVVVRNLGNTPVPVEEGPFVLRPVVETEISMESESVQISELGGFKVKCSFVMQSHSKDIETRTVGFPVRRPVYGEFMRKSFNVTVDNEPVETSLHMNVETSWATEVYWEPDYHNNDYAGYVTWRMTWAPGQRKTILCNFDMGGPERFYCDFVEGWRLRYIVRTGALWRASIGRADITVSFQPKSHRNSLFNVWTRKLKDRPCPIFRYSYPERAQQDGEGRIQWRFENWNPKDDLIIENVAWVGLTERYRFRLPHPYKADTKLYTDDFLEQLVDNELRPWHYIFREQVEALDRRQLKGHIAECLSQEILARHGEAFSLGLLENGQSPPVGATSLPQGRGHCYGIWNQYFKSYSYHGGWYRPDTDKTTAEIMQELNSIERKNRALLINYVAPQAQANQQ
jgi:hypothetical protein